MFTAYNKLTVNSSWLPAGETVAGNGTVGTDALLSLSGPGPTVLDGNSNHYVNDDDHHRVICNPSDESVEITEWHSCGQ